MNASQDEALDEQLLKAWIVLNGLLKDSLMTQGLTYNEAIVMNVVYTNHRAGYEHTSTQQLITVTGFLKSLMNRTIDSLCKQGFLRKQKVGRTLSVSLIEEKLPAFLKVHEHSLDLVHEILEVIGVDDALTFIGISKKLNESSIRERLKG